MKKATLYKNLGDKKVQCLACQRYCKPPVGKSGYCGVRRNVDGELNLLVHGKAIAVHTDPIEKKPLFHFMPGSDVFSFGTIGCNFRCSFCQNWDISQATALVRERYKKPDEAELVLGKICDEGQDLPPKKIVEYCVKNKIPIIAYTYNEPTIFAEYAGDTALLARKKGIKNVFVSNGYESKECLDYMKGWCDAINIDIKSFSEDFYMKVCGAAKLSGVLDTVKRAWKLGIWTEITTLVIPGLNDSDKELGEIAEFIASVSVDIPWHATAFHPAYRMEDRESTPPETLERAWKIGKDAGLKYVYVGNIPGMEHEHTHCHKCDEELIVRWGVGFESEKIKEEL